MIKLIHTADLHLCSPLTARLTHSQIAERKQEILSTLNTLCQTAVREGVSAVLIAGDLFDHDRVNTSGLETVLALLAGHPQLTFYYLPGNHEKALLTASGLPMPGNLRIFGEDWTYFTLGEITVAGRSETAADMFDTLRLPPDGVNLVVLHGEVRPRSAPNGVIGLTEAAECPIDYLALGHYHSYAEHSLGRRGVAVYAGTPEGRGFDECGEKGAVLITVDGHAVTHRFLPTARRRLWDIPCDVSDCADLRAAEDRMTDALQGIPPQDLVRLRLVGRRPPDSPLNLTALTARFRSGYYHFELRDESRLLLRAEDYRYDRSLRGEFIRLVLADPTLEEEQQERIIRCGLSALSGERGAELGGNL